MAPASDSGALGDDVTNVTQPAITGTGTSGDIVTLYDGGSAVGTAFISSDGTFVVSPSTSMLVGAHSLTATQTDLAGNISPASTDLALAIVPTIYQIYDTAATLICTETSLSLMPGFSTTGLVGGAVSFTDVSSGVITLMSENNTITTEGNDTVSAGSGNDTIYAAGATTSLTGGSGSMFFVGGSGSSSVAGGTGSSTILDDSGGGSFQGGTGGGNVLVAGGGETSPLAISRPSLRRLPVPNGTGKNTP